jgi:hypothetical protein
MTIKTIMPDFKLRRADSDGNYLVTKAAHDLAGDYANPCLELSAGSLTYGEVEMLRNWLNDWLGHHRPADAIHKDPT